MKGNQDSTLGRALANDLHMPLSGPCLMALMVRSMSCSVLSTLPAMHNFAFTAPHMGIRHLMGPVKAPLRAYKTLKGFLTHLESP